MRKRNVLTTRLARMLAALLLALVPALLTVVGVSPQAAAEEECVPPDILVMDEVTTEDGETRIVWVCEDRGGGGGDGDEGEEGSCDLTNIADYDYWYEESGGNIYCIGDRTCASRVPSVMSEEFWPPDPPEPWSIYTDTQCFDDAGNLEDYWFSWYTPDEPPLLYQAQEALQTLRTPGFELAFNPANLSFVGTETYFWADLTDAGLLTSTVFAVTATATASHVTVDPGNGDAVLNCGWAVAKSADCAKVYPDSSVTGSARGNNGQPAFAADATLTYDVAFTVGGAPLPANIAAQLPDTLTSPPESAAVPVGEVQVIID